jgi:putative PIN family toxin of toxin-antitoxin system
VSVPQVVLDTNVLVSALRSRRGTSHQLLLLMGTGKFDLGLSVPLFLEYEEVCKRQLDEFELTERDLQDVLDFLCRAAKRTPVYFLWRPFLKDASDDMVLELAVSAGSDYIVTYNLADFEGADQFGVGVRTPGAFLREIGELP